jgi:thiazole synthase ThiGH ThiG subunit
MRSRFSNFRVTSAEQRFLDENVDLFTVTLTLLALRAQNKASAEQRFLDGNMTLNITALEGTADAQEALEGIAETQLSLRIGGNC